VNRFSQSLVPEAARAIGENGWFYTKKFPSFSQYSISHSSRTVTQNCQPIKMCREATLFKRCKLATARTQFAIFVWVLSFMTLTLGSSKILPAETATKSGEAKSNSAFISHGQSIRVGFEVGNHEHSMKATTYRSPDLSNLFSATFFVVLEMNLDSASPLKRPYQGGKYKC
jgi:hypothetical protein